MEPLRGSNALVPWFPPPDRPARILIVRLSAVGDVVHALPVLAALRARLPDARIDWAVEDRAAALLDARPDLDRIVVFPRRALRARAPRAAARRLAAFATALCRGGYDLALDLQGNLKSGLVSRKSKARVRAGLDGRRAREGNHLFSTRRWAPRGARVHRVEQNLGLLGSVLGEPVAWRDPGFPVSEAATARADRLLEAAALAPGFTLLHPSTSRFGAFKRWPPERFGALARRLAADGAVAVTHGPGEADLADRVLAAARGAAVAIETPTLPVLAAVIRRSGAFVAADTGPLHLAALVGTPLLGLFGPKDPAVYGPYGRRADGSVGVLPVHVVDDVGCRPCRLRACADPLCMRTMEPAAVHGALTRAAASPARASG